MSGLAARASAERGNSRSNRVASRRALFSVSAMGRAGYLDFTGAPDKTPRPFFQGVGTGRTAPAHLGKQGRGSRPFESERSEALQEDARGQQVRPPREREEDPHGGVELRHRRPR